MSTYIAKIENVIWDSKDSAGLGPTHLNEIRVFFIEPPHKNKYNLYIEHVRLWNNLGVELFYAREYSLLIPTAIYPSKCHFRFEFDKDFIQLLDGAVFEISLKKTGANPIETIRYILKDGQWEEMTEEHE